MCPSAPKPAALAHRWSLFDTQGPDLAEVGLLEFCRQSHHLRHHQQRLPGSRKTASLSGAITTTTTTPRTDFIYESVRTSRRGLVVARCVVAGRSRVRGRVEAGLLLSRVATTHTGGRARGDYPTTTIAMTMPLPLPVELSSRNAMWFVSIGSLSPHSNLLKIRSILILSARI